MPTILVVDDDSSIQKLLEVTLSDLGDIVCVGTGEDALAHTAESLPDLVVLDVALPGTSGLDVLRTWRGDERTRDLEVVLLSGRDEPRDEAAGYDAGADAYVTKPADVDVLQSLLAAMLADREVAKRQVLDEFRGLTTPDFPGADFR